MSAITGFAAFFKMSKFITLSALDAKSQRYNVVMDLNLLHYLRLQLTFGRLRIDPLNLKGKSEQDHLHYRSYTLSGSQKKIFLSLTYQFFLFRVVVFSLGCLKLN